MIKLGLYVLNEHELKKVSAIFNALSNPTRLKIIKLVSETERPLHIKALAKAVGKDYAAVYRHVGVLVKIGVVGIYDVGRSRVIYLKNSDTVKECIRIAKKML